MKQCCRYGLAAVILVLLVVGLSACNSRSRAQSQSDRDQENRERVADATAKAKEEGEKAAQEVKAAARQSEHDAKVAAQGVKEGWDRDKQGRLDVNSAPKSDLRSLGLSDDEAQRVINGRPYKDTRELVTRGIVTRSEYSNIQDQITVLSPAHSPQP